MPTSDELLYAMRSGQPQPDASIAAFVAGVVDGSVSRPQAAAWLAWAFQRGLTDAETTALTHAMTNSGDVLSWEDGPPLCDKHSTGGVGDKVSLVLAPLWAELGLRVPMISGRGLGHTGGTLDKLEAIPGFRTDHTEGTLRRILRDVGCFVTGQTASLAPADRVLYGLRNETCTVESIPLIVGSILSKKLAAGVQGLVLDVKTGSGAFMVAHDDAVALARALVRVGNLAGMKTTARVTGMDEPLGLAVGNALEVAESVETLRGGGPPDLVALTLALTEDPRAAEVLRSGRAYERWARMVHAQGGDPDGRLLGDGTTTLALTAPRSGFVTRVDARGVGRAAFVAGAGRRRAEDPVDPGVGVTLRVKVGAQVHAGDELALLHHRGVATDEALRLLTGAFAVGDEAGPAAPLVRAVIGATGRA
jgi:pyrimidine-nucleoside phosphorylase